MKKAKHADVRDVRALAVDIDARLDPDVRPLVTAACQRLYESMPNDALKILRWAFMLDRAQPGSSATTRAFCDSRIALIDRVRRV